jgi:hypothetical protein
MDGQGPSRGQLEFAERMDCGMVMRCVGQAVCLYRVISHETIRWIVDSDGTVLDWAVFHAGV